MKTSTLVVVGVIGAFLLHRHKQKAEVTAALGTGIAIKSAPQAPTVSAVAPASPVLLAPPDYADPSLAAETAGPTRYAPVDEAGDIIVW